MIQVFHITNGQQQKEAFRIRDEVFVQEQCVPSEEEYDEYEETSRHFLAHAEGTPCGTARWRFTDKGIKLERFAVLKEFRSRRAGSALVQAVLEDVKHHPQFKNQTIYLHAQVTAMPLYAKFGFQPVGDMFLECDIQHYKMKL